MLLRWLTSLLLSVALVAWLLSGIELSELGRTLRDAHQPSLVMFALVYGAGLLARATRYRLLLDQPVPPVKLLLITQVRNMLADLLPARLGSIVYVYLVTTRANISLPRGLSSFMLAFVFDIMAITPLLLLALLTVGGAAPIGSNFLPLLAILLFLGSFASLPALAPVLRFVARALGGIATARPLVWAAEATAVEVDASWGTGRLLQVLALSMGVRLCKFGALYCLLHAVLVPHGYDWGSLAPAPTFLGIAGAELSAMLPIQGVAGFGTYEAAWSLAFTKLGFPESLAILSGLASHLISQVFEYSIGVAALLWLMRPRSFGLDGG